jgi:long-chain-fatty-acid--[acyl-carrier-protein] ligase
LAWFVRCILSLRYKVEVRGMNCVPADGGVLFLANHPAMVDPLILLSQIGSRFRVRPLVLQYFFLLPGLRWFMKLLDAFPIPDLSTGANTYKRFRVQQAAEELEAGLRIGQRFLVYPSGRLKQGPAEIVGGASLAHQLVRDVPEAMVVLCRIDGLWGSRFSKALTGKRPELATELKRGFLNVLKNLIFFMPRRRVTITLEIAPPEVRQAPSRLEFNKGLERFFNQYQCVSGISGDEPLHLVHESIWKRASLPPLAPAQADEVIDTRRLPTAVKQAVLEEISALTHRPEDEIKTTDDLSADLGMDSLDIAQLVAYLEKEFDVAVTTPAHLKTVAHVMAAAADIQFGEEEELAPTTWHQDVDERRPEAQAPVGVSCIEAWLRACDRLGPWEAAGDDRSGPRTYDQLKLGTLVLAEAFRALPGKNIGVMLPACVPVNVVVLAIQLAGKVPVMLNWTMGAGPLAHAVEVAQLEVVISSLAFLDRLESVDLTPIHRKLILLEEIRDHVSLKSLLQSKLRARKKASEILKAYGRDQDTGDETAVVLFTSGTESNPKGVPLTHNNLLSNHRAAFPLVELRRRDVMLGSIPPFHSFGLSVTALFPLLAGVRVAFYPDPTNGRALARVCSSWQCTIACAPPTFLKGLIHAGSGGQLRCVRLFVSGAEKAPDEMFNQVKVVSPGSELIEGYGITECSPVLTINIPGTPRAGVGSPLPGVELLIVHPETMEPLPVGAQGLILATGPNIFPGYLGLSVNPFHDYAGKRWYNTGDLGFLDETGHLTLSGRLKRFVKIGGEMISLSAIEQVLLGAVPAEHPVPAVALKAREEVGQKTTLHAFVTFPLTLEEANQMIKAAGFSNLARLTSVRQLKELPLLGSGKINYRGLPDVG